MKKSKEDSDRYAERAEKIKRIIEKKEKKMEKKGKKVKHSSQESTSEEEESQEVPEPPPRVMPMPVQRKTKFDSDLERAIQESLMFAESAAMAAK